jgi:hypothetical protein
MVMEQSNDFSQVIPVDLPVPGGIYYVKLACENGKSGLEKIAIVR